MTVVAGTSYTTNTTTTQKTTTSTTDNSLGKDSFLKLLMVQLQNQDPLKPMDDTQFISQMAQFSSLEQMQNMSSTMSNLQAANMVGKPINWTDDKGNVQSGTVDAITMVNGTAKLQVGEQLIDLSSVTAMGTTDDIVQMAQLTNMTNIQAMSTIGKKVTWTDTDGNDKSGIVDAVSISSGNAKLVIGDTTVNFSSVKKIENA
jgi:flagellar basal-body rod modification protein FlgD